MGPPDARKQISKICFRPCWPSKWPETDFDELVKICFRPCWPSKWLETDFDELVKICFRPCWPSKWPETDFDELVKICFQCPKDAKINGNGYWRARQNMFPRLFRSPPVEEKIIF